MQINLALHTFSTAADLIKKTFQQAGWVFYLFLEWKKHSFLRFVIYKTKSFHWTCSLECSLKTCPNMCLQVVFFPVCKTTTSLFSKNLMVLLVLFLWKRMTVQGGCKEKKWSRNSCELALSIVLLVLRREHWLYQHRYAMSLDLTCVRMV